MVAKKPRIVVIGAGMAGVTAANKLHTSGCEDLFELIVVEGGTRIGGRINTSEFGGDRIEMGATWIHGIGGSPVHKIAQEIKALESEQPWECMDGSSDEPKTIAEGGFEVSPTVVDPITTLFKNLMDYAQGKKVFEESDEQDGNGDVKYMKLGDEASGVCCGNGGAGKLSVGSFLRKGLDAYWVSKKRKEEVNGCGEWGRESLEEAVFAMHESTQRTYTSAGDLLTLDYNAESEYRMFPGEEITIAKGYLSIVQSLASVLPPDVIQLGKRVTKVEWKAESTQLRMDQNGYESRPVKLHFSDGSVLLADHVIVTVSLGVLKAATHQESGMFSPPLPCFKADAISRLGFGVVNKLFLQLSSTHVTKGQDFSKFPFLQMVFHREDSEFRLKKIPWWMRKTASLCPLYHNSSVLLSWFAGKEALELESLEDEEIINGVTATVSSFLSKPHKKERENSHSQLGNGHVNHDEENSEVKFANVLKSQWGSDPLFLGSYSYVAVGSSGEDLDTMAEPLPKLSSCDEAVSATSPPSLQILFAGEATHRTHYSTTHGAYFSGLREAIRLLQHYNHHVGV
ncbi:putative polyamine oxidase 5 [Rosa sericea]